MVVKKKDIVCTKIYLKYNISDSTILFVLYNLPRTYLFIKRVRIFFIVRIIEASKDGGRSFTALSNSASPLYNVLSYCKGDLYERTFLRRYFYCYLYVIIFSNFKNYIINLICHTYKIVFLTTLDSVKC